MSFPVGAIREANNHIQALSKTNLELAEKVKELSHVIRKQNEAHAENLAVLPLRMKQTMIQKDEEIHDLRNTVNILRREAKEREIVLQHFQNKCKLLDEVSRHREALESILSCLDLVQEPFSDVHMEGNNNHHTSADQVRETDLTNGYYEPEANTRDVSRDNSRSYRMDSGIGEEHDIVAL